MIRVGIISTTWEPHGRLNIMPPAFSNALNMFLVQYITAPKEIVLARFTRIKVGGIEVMRPKRLAW